MCVLICVQSAEGEQVDSGDQTRSGGIGKKMKAISLTMMKRMGRNYAKALSEEMVSEQSTLCHTDQASTFSVRQTSDKSQKSEM